MKLTIEIIMDNSAFEDSNGTECARILLELAAELDGFHFEIAEHVATLRDINGNEVGQARIGH